MNASDKTSDLIWEAYTSPPNTFGIKHWVLTQVEQGILMLEDDAEGYEQGLRAYRTTSDVRLRIGTRLYEFVDTDDSYAWIIFSEDVDDAERLVEFTEETFSPSQISVVYVR